MPQSHTSWLTKDQQSNPWSRPSQPERKGPPVQWYYWLGQKTAVVHCNQHTSSSAGVVMEGGRYNLAPARILLGERSWSLSVKYDVDYLSNNAKFQHNAFFF